MGKDKKPGEVPVEKEKKRARGRPGLLPWEKAPARGQGAKKRAGCRQASREG